MSDSISSNKRIAQNTVLLYFRTILVMVISLYTSRVILSTLGVSDFGIYSVVGGVVAMLSVITGSLATAISRYITFELGHGDVNKLNKIFIACVNVQIGFSLIVILIGETLGVWFLNYKMNIPPDRLYSANWVLQCSLVTFILNLISIPYSATIIAHEKMSAFAYISILEVVLKLLVVYALYVSPIDKLISYAVLLVLVSVIVRLVYGAYCNKRFVETKYHFEIDKKLIGEIGGFAGWGFLLHAVSLLNTNGIGVLVNLFFTVSVNGALGIANQVQSAFNQLVRNFATALNPQITKLYASGNYERMNELCVSGSKLTFFLSLLICVPLFFETHYILSLWLGNVPEHTVAFVRLTIICSTIQQLGDTGYTAFMATGKVKKYAIVIGIASAMVFPLTYIFYKLGYPPETTYFIYGTVYIFVNLIRLYLMKKEMNFPSIRFLREVYGRIVIVMLASIMIPYILINYLSESFGRLVIILFLSIMVTGVSSYFLGMNKKEKRIVLQFVQDKMERCHK